MVPMISPLLVFTPTCTPFLLNVGWSSYFLLRQYRKGEGILMNSKDCELHLTSRLSLLPSLHNCINQLPCWKESWDKALTLTLGQHPSRN